MNAKRLRTIIELVLVIGITLMWYRDPHGASVFFHDIGTWIGDAWRGTGR